MEPIPAHPLAEAYPLLTGEEYEAFKENVRANGLLNPVWLHEGLVLDGRNRQRACCELGIAPRYERYAGDDPAGFVDSQNLHRRHLTAEWRRERVKELRAAGMSTREIAAEMGIHKTQVLRDMKANEVVTLCPPDPPPAPPPRSRQPEPEPPAPPPSPPKVTGLDGKKYPGRKPGRPKKAAEPNPPTADPPPAWAEAAEQLSRIASVVERASGDLPEEIKPWTLVESLERTGRALLRRAGELRRRHHL